LKSEQKIDVPANEENGSAKLRKDGFSGFGFFRFFG